MKITVLSFAGCPNHPPALAMVRRVVTTHAVNAEIEEIEVSADDAAKLRFLGSPTVQVDGVDIELAARARTDFAMSCRVYAEPDGLPTEAMLLKALGIDTAAGPGAPQTGSR